MASEYSNLNLTTQKIEVIHAVQPWLNKEIAHRKDVSFYSHQGSPADTRDYLLDEEVPDEWNEFQLARKNGQDNPAVDERCMQVAQSVLRACASSQVAYIWDQVDAGAGLDVAHYRSQVMLDGFVEKWRRAHLLSTELLEKPLIEAVEEFTGEKGAYYKPKEVFKALVSLSLTAVTEQSLETVDPLLPEPGADRGVLNPWKHQ